MYRKKYGEHVYLHWVNGLNYGLFFLLLFCFFFSFLLVLFLFFFSFLLVLFLFFFSFLLVLFLFFLLICLFAHNGNCATVMVC